MQLANLAGVIISVLGYLVVLVGVYAFVHAALQRPDAYTATGKLTPRMASHTGLVSLPVAV